MVAKVKILGPFQKSKKIGVDCSKDKVRTQQQFKEECDINVIVLRAKRGEALIPQFMDRRDRMIFGDFSSIQTYEQANEIMIEANSMFMALPAKIRDRFSNDPSKLLNFVQNPENRAEAEFLGIIEKKPVEMVEKPAEKAPPSKT